MPLLQTDGSTLYYELAGRGEPVLLIQGVGVTGEGWRPQVDGLADEFQTVVFDNRGIGRSAAKNGAITIEAMAGDARALMDELGWKSAHIVGHSLGGVIAQQLALDCPQRVRSLALLCTFVRGKDGARPTPWVLWMSLRTRLGTRAMRRRAFLKMLFPEDYRRRADLGRLAQQVARIVGRDLADQPPILMKQVRALGRHDTSARLGELAAIPTLVISGGRDPIARPAYGRALAAAIPGARFEDWAEDAHGLPIQHAERLNRRLKEFFTDTGSPEKDR